jgi:citrate synthase
MNRKPREQSKTNPAGAGERRSLAADTAGAWISAADAASLLRIRNATLYAYVSRGLVRSQGVPGSPRARTYSREDVERLRRRTEERRAPDKAAARALNWGLPVLESAITLIDGQRLYYRGWDVTMLAETRSVAEVAALVWTGEFKADVAQLPASRMKVAGGRTGGFVARAQSMLARAETHDPQAFDLRQRRVVRTGWEILRLLTNAATGIDPGDAPIERVLARAWRVPARGVDVLRAALVLCADHELNVSSFTARSVASAGSPPYAVVIAGLAALEGPRHGGAGARVASMLTTMRGVKPLDAAVAGRLQRGEPLDGFGHPLYPAGDPRATMLLSLLRDRSFRAGEHRFAMQVVDAVARVTGQQPNVDFALVAMTRVLALPSEAALMVFAIARAIGWIGHAIEQYATGQLIRPRATYVGVVPRTPGSAGAA